MCVTSVYFSGITCAYQYIYLCILKYDADIYKSCRHIQALENVYIKYIV